MLFSSVGRRVAAALVVLAGLLAAVLVFGDTTGNAKPANAPKAKQTKSLAPTRAVPRELAANFELLRGSAAHNLSGRDLEAPAQVQRDFANSDLVEKLGLNVSLARGTVTPASSVPVWIVPGVDSACIWIADPIDGAGISCDPTSSILEDGLLVTLVKPGRPELTIAGLVPDDVSRVQLNKRTSQVGAPRTENGTFGATSVAATSVMLQRSSGEQHDVPLARP